jgi:hypothetical protein
LDSVVAFAELSGTIYAATRHFLYRSDSSGWIAASADFLNITGIMSSGTESGIYLSIGDTEQREGGVAFWSESEQQDPVSYSGLGGNEVSEVEVDENGLTWITTGGLRNGYSIYEQGEWSGRTRNAENSQHFFRNMPQNIAFDEFGGTWFASQGGGVLWIRDDSIVFFDRSIQSGFDVNGPRLLGHNEVGSFLVTRVTSDNEGGIYISNRLVTPGPGPSLIHVTRDWIAQGNHSEPWIYYTVPQVVPGNPTEVEELLTDPYGRVWVGASPDGNQTSVLRSGNPEDWFGYDPREHQDDAFTCFRDIDTQVQTWAVDHQNYLWVGTPTGAYYTQGGLPLNLDQLHFICVIDMPVGNRVNDIHVDSQDNKWFGTDEGVAVLDKDFNWIHVFQTASSVDYPSNLTSNNITSIASNPNTGEIWIGTQEGLSLLESPYISRTANLDELMLYPNPYRADGTQRLYVDAMSLGGAFDEMRVFTTTGRLVRELTWNTMITTGWDGRNGEGDLVAGGVYLVVVTTTEGSSVTGKVAVLGK